MKILAVERTSSFNRERILWCCQQNQVSIEELARAAGMSNPDNLNKALSEDAGLTLRQLEKIAEYFHRSLNFFFEDGAVDAEQFYSPQFRTLNNVKPNLTRKTKILIRRVEEQREIFVGLLDDDEDYESPPWVTNRIQRMGQESIKQFAARVRIWLGFDNIKKRHTFDTYRLALERAGVLIFVTNSMAGPWQIEKGSPIRGFSLYFDLYPVVVVKKQDTPPAHCFTVMHELGHLLLHRTSSIDEEADFFSHRKQEKEANEFAGNLLVPDHFLATIELTKFPYSAPSEYDEYLSEWRKSWGVSGDVIVRRLHDEGFITKEDYEKYLAFKRAIVPEESDKDIPRHRGTEPLRMFGSTFVSAIFHALHSDQISLYKASTYLDNLQIIDLKKLERKIAHV
ncbi:MAG: ImmA/IrrE family metallo-endopeptidase [Proteobacteria bacterium]|nr:MAG: ImmA/IrrE family metallo-endopeptidase [Pseudomonadota bacterium]